MDLIKMDRENNAKLFRLKIKMKLKDRLEKRKLVKPPIKPKYDEVFFKGLDWLDTL